jgi:3-dehydroquinate synthetase
MGAGKTTVGREVALLLERPFVDLDGEIERVHGPIAEIFEQRGEAEFRRLEEEVLADVLCGEPAVVALGGGAVLSERSRHRLRRSAFTVLLETDVQTAWGRARRSGRPLARDEAEFRRLFAERADVYADVADEVAADVEGVLLGCLRIDVAAGARPAVGGSSALVADEHVLELYPDGRDGFSSVHAIPAGEAAKDLAVAARLWDELELERSDTIVALGGGATTDVSGFVAATYLRGVPWIAWPTTLVGQVDAAVGGKTAIDLAKGKNLVGAFHLPERVVIDPDFLATLGPAQRREGMAEVVKTGLLAGRELWALDDVAMVRGCAAFKAGVVVSDPKERGRRAILNLGHTFAHALETGAGHGAVSHGSAVALGLTAALRLSERHLGLEPAWRGEVVRLLGAEPVPADGEAAWAALERDKKARAGKVRLVLLESFGKPVHGIELPDDEVRAELDSLIAK